jgi:hypothetical protein
MVIHIDLIQKEDIEVVTMSAVESKVDADINDKK